jgi:hypothetical protein
LNSLLIAVDAQIVDAQAFYGPDVTPQNDALFSGVILPATRA